MTFSDISNKKFKGHLKIKKMFGNILELLNVQYFYEIQGFQRQNRVKFVLFWTK